MNSKKLTIGLFIIYIVALVWIILLKLQFSFASLDHFRGINLIPFAGSVIVNGKIELSEIFKNIIIFIPYGIYIYMLKPKWKFINHIVPIILTSLALEILQYILSIGATDITDLIGNTIGGVVGLGIYFIFSNLFRDNALKIVNIIALLASVLMIMFIGVLLMANA